MKKLTIRIKLYVLKGLYVFLDLLTNLTCANSHLARKKIQIGTAIISLTLLLNSCSSSTDSSLKKNEKKEVVETRSTCYLPVPPISDLSKAEKTDTLSKRTRPKIPKIISNPKDSLVTIVSCYDGVDPIEMLPIEEINKDDTLSIAEQMPVFKGGLDSMRQFIARNLNYPKELTDIDVVGRVILQFTVTHKGDIEHIRVIRSLYPPCDNEAIRVVKMMPKWIPGKQGGVERNVRYTLPIRFDIE